MNNYKLKGKFLNNRIYEVFKTYNNTFLLRMNGCLVHVDYTGK
jgi:hypothetical protein